MNSEYSLIHAKRARKKGKGRKHQQAFHPYSHPQGKGQSDFSFDTIHGMKLKETQYVVPSSAERKARRAEFQGSNGKEGVRSKFLKMLANDHKQELKDRLGMSDAEIARMAEGKSVNGYNVHHKLPIHGGGKNEFSNFIITPLYPHDQWHHDVLDKQIEGMVEGSRRTVLLPWSDEMIYDPKTFGFTKENQPVQPNYTSKVNPANYPKIYKPEHITDAAARKRELNRFAPSPSKGAQKAPQRKKLIASIMRDCR
ncbi:MAG: HNH endonuclease [Alphaproteobacteria bacterium]|nr:HNH endonuclease [Alphaproteobacteria bacterium]